MKGSRNKKKTIRTSPRVSLRKSVVTSPRATIEVGRNDPCPCGSGEKYKNCHLKEGDIWLRRIAKQKEKERMKQEGGFLKKWWEARKRRKEQAKNSTV